MIKICAFLLAGLIYVQGKTHETCIRNYDNIGCYKEDDPGSKHLIINDRENIDWKNIQAYMHSLACRCDKATRERNKKISRDEDMYIGFALHYYGECYGRTSAHMMRVQALSHQEKLCVGDQSYRGCRQGEHKECVGIAQAEYVYKFKTKAAIDINGGYSEWEPWTQCLSDCGPGQRLRERTCTNPEPQGNGKDCEVLGPSTESQACMNKQCPVDGGFSEWTDFGKCTAECGGGTHTRTRLCTKPAPSHGGKACDGPATESRHCNTAPCPVDGGWNTWSSYGACSASCGGGNQKRMRGCINPLPKYGGKDCVGSSMESRPCGTKPCPVDGGFSKWSKFGECSAKCGGGSQTRTRKCTKPVPAHGGKNCEGPSKESQICNTTPCPVDGGWKQWSVFGACSASCGGGKKKRMRTCINPPPKYGGKDCVGPSEEFRPCGVKPCPVDGGYTAWTSYGACSKSCGPGHLQTRTRTCTNPSPAHGGQNCLKLGPASEQKACPTKHCPIIEFKKRVCEYGYIYLTCGSGRINITYAMYGRLSRSYCSHWLFLWRSSNCRAASSYSKVRAACQNKKACRVYASNIVFGEPCRGTRKYLEIKYSCQ